MSVSTKFWDILQSQNDKSSVLRMAIISFLKPAEYIEIALMKASLKLLNLDVQGQLDVLRPFLLVQLHFFFFAQLSGRHFSDDKVEFFFLIQCCEGQSTVSLSIQVKCQKKVFFLMWMQNMVYLFICYGDQSVSW